MPPRLQGDYRPYPAGRPQPRQGQQGPANPVPAQAMSSLHPTPVEAPQEEDTAREISPEERSTDASVRLQYGGTISRERAATLLALIVESAPHALDQRYQGIAAARTLLETNSELWPTLFQDWTDGNFDRTRQLPALQNDVHIQTLAVLNNEFSEVYPLLVLKVSTWNQWKMPDVCQNCAMYYGNETNVPKILSDLQSDLGRRREYFSFASKLDLQFAEIAYKQQFDKVFAKNPGAREMNSKEFFSFFVLNHSFLVDTISAVQDSSNFKAGAFCHFFVHTPFLYIEFPGLKFKQDQSWGFPIFLKLPDGNTVRYTPKSDWMVVDDVFMHPIVISEIVSQKNEDDEHRMLLQAIAAVRVGQYYAKPENKFFVVAIYLTANLVAKRYILISEGGPKPQPNVHTLRKEFNLKNSDAANSFLLEMLNLKSKTESLSGMFSAENKVSLSRLSHIAQGLKSLHSKDRPTSRGNRHAGSSNNNNIYPGTRNIGPSDPVDGDMYGTFQDYNLQIELDKLGYEILYTPSPNPDLAVVRPRNDRETTHYVKFIPDYSDELQVIMYLNSLKSPSDSIIRPIGSSTCPGGSLMAMRGAGRWITNIEDLTAHLPDLILQLLEGVKFLHDNLVAHLDLKPENLLASTTNPAEPKLTIIDFSCAILVDTPSSLVETVQGTKGFMAPEIGSGPYNPFKADIWSFGVVLIRLCEACGDFPQRSLILMIAAQLIQPDPNRRPGLLEIQQWIRSSPDSEIGTSKASDVLWSIPSFPTGVVSVF